MMHDSALARMWCMLADLARSALDFVLVIVLI